MALVQWWSGFLSCYNSKGREIQYSSCLHPHRFSLRASHSVSSALLRPLRRFMPRLPGKGNVIRSLKCSSSPVDLAGIRDEEASFIYFLTSTIFNLRRAVVAIVRSSHRRDKPISPLATRANPWLDILFYVAFGGFSPVCQLRLSLEAFLIQLC